MMNAMMMKLAAKGAAIAIAATMFATGVPALAAHAADPYAYSLGDLETTQYGYDLPVTIDNQTGKCIQNLYVAPTADMIWGADLCGDYFLYNGYSIDSTFDVHGNHTVYEIYVVFADGTDAVYEAVDLSGAPITGIDLVLAGNGIAYINY